MRNVLIWLGDMKDIYAMYYASADAIEINDSGDGFKSKRELRKSMIKRLDSVTRNKILDILGAEFDGDKAKAQTLTAALSNDELDSLSKINDVLEKAHGQNLLGWQDRKKSLATSKMVL